MMQSNALMEEELEKQKLGMNKKDSQYSKYRDNYHLGQTP